MLLAIDIIKYLERKITDILSIGYLDSDNQILTRLSIYHIDTQVLDLAST